MGVLIMKKWVSTLEKREFLHWFISQYRLKNHEARRLLEVIMNNPHILENASFCEKINEEQKTIVVSSLYSEEIGFAFFYKDSKITDISSAIANITQSPSEKVFIILHFHGKMLNHRYLQLIETPESEKISHNKVHQQQLKEVNSIIKSISLEHSINEIKKQIDLALDLKDAQLFKELTDQLKKLQS